MISNFHLTRALGFGASNLSVVTSAILALTSFFYLYTMGSYFKISIYVLQDRITYNTSFVDQYIINKFFDHLILSSGILLWLAFSVQGRSKARFVISAIYGGLMAIAVFSKVAIILDVLALLSLPIVISLLIYSKFFASDKKKRILNMNTSSLSANYLAIIGIATGITSIIISLVPILFSVSQTSIPFRNYVYLFSVSEGSLLVRSYAYDIFLLFSSFSPVLIFLLIFSLPIKLLINAAMTKILPKIKNDNNHKENNSLLHGGSIRLRTKAVYLTFFMMLALMIALIPHQPTVNKNNQQVGADTRKYVSIEDTLLRSKDAQEFIRQAFVLEEHGDRPLSLIFLFTIAKFTSANLFNMIDYVPIILGPLLVVVVYYLTRELTLNDTTSLLAAFFTAISFHTLIGIYSGFYANWIALIIGYLSFVFFFRYLKTRSKLNIVIYSALTVLLLFSHVYTWTIFTIVMAIFLGVMFKFNSYPRKTLILLFLVILSSVVIDIARTSMTGSSGGIEGDIKVAHIEGTGLGQFALRWSNLVYSVQVINGGQLSNFIILTLGLYWLFRSNLQEQSSIFIVIFLLIAFIPLFFGDYLIQSRVLYDIPFQIPAAIALTYIKKEQSHGTMMILPVCIWLTAISIRAVSNFYFILPS